MSLFRQINDSDCGIICLEYLFYYFFKLPCNRNRIVKELNDTDKGISLASLVNLLIKNSINAKALKCNNINKIPTLPAILLLQDKSINKGHYVVLLNTLKKRVVIFDPYYGRKLKIHKHKLNQVWKGVFIDISFTNTNPSVIKNNNKPFKVNKTLLILLELIQIVLQISNLILLNEFLNKDNYQFLLIIIVIQASLLIINYFQIYLFHKISKKTSNYLESNIIKNLFFMPVSYLRNFRSSDLYIRFLEVFNYKKILLTKNNNYIITIILLVLGQLSLLLLTFPFGLFSLCFNLSNFVFKFVYNKTTIKVYENLKENEVKINAEIINYCDNKEIIKANEYEGYFYYSYLNNLKNLSHYESILQRKNKVVDYINNLGQFILVGFLIYYHDLDNLIIYFMFHYFLTHIWNQVIVTNNQIAEDRITIKRIDEIKEMPINEDNNVKVKIDNLTLLLDKINFSYYNKKIFNDFNYIFKGVTYLSGDSGTGKTTLMSLILGHNLNYKGKIFFNDVELNEITFIKYKANFSYLCAKSIIINDTLKNNLLLNLKMNNDDLKQILNESELYALLNKWDLDDYIDKNELSNGEKQIIALVRAIIEDKNVLLIDEGLEFIDCKRQIYIIKLLNKLYQDRILIICGVSLVDIIKSEKINILDLNSLQKCV